MIRTGFRREFVWFGQCTRTFLTTGDLKTVNPTKCVFLFVCYYLGVGDQIRIINCYVCGTFLHSRAQSFATSSRTVVYFIIMSLCVCVCCAITLLFVLLSLCLYRALRHYIHVIVFKTLVSWFKRKRNRSGMLANRNDSLTCRLFKLEIWNFQK